MLWILLCFCAIINQLSENREGKEACRPLNVPHFSTAAKISDFLHVCLCESLHIINVFWKLSLKLFKSWGRSYVISLKLLMYSHKDNVCQLLPRNYITLYYRIWQISTVYFNCVLLNFNFNLRECNMIVLTCPYVDYVDVCISVENACNLNYVIKQSDLQL